MNPVNERLIELIRTGNTLSKNGFDVSDVAPDSMPDEPERFDWRGKIPIELRRLWTELSLETRLALCFSAQLEAFWDA